MSERSKKVLTNFAATLMALLLVLGGWLGLHHLQERRASSVESTNERLQSAAQNRDLRLDLQKVRAEVKQLRKALAASTQTQTLDAAACKALRNTMGVMESESARLREQLNFYKLLAKPEELRAGVRVQDLRIRPQGDGMHFELVLIQSIRAEERIAGTVDIVLQGKRGAAQMNLPLKQMVTSGDRELVFSFKYYDEFAGDFKLPDNFKPDKVVVTMRAVNNRPVATDEFPWNIVAPGADSHEEISTE